MSDKVNITFDTLFALLRIERNREELQELDKSFFNNVVEYLNDKIKTLEEEGNKDDLFSSVEKEKARKQIMNIRKLLKELSMC